MACDLYCCSIEEGFPHVALAPTQNHNYWNLTQSYRRLRARHKNVANIASISKKRGAVYYAGNLQGQKEFRILPYRPMA